MEMMIWNFVLTSFVAILGFLMKGKMDELNRLGILLNRTREEVARDQVTRAEVNQTMDRLADKIEASIQRLESKIDQIAQKG